MVTPRAVAALFRKIGPAVLLTHLAGGVGWLMALRVPSLVEAIVAYEPVRFLFPPGELPPRIEGGFPRRMCRSRSSRS